MRSSARLAHLRAPLRHRDFRLIWIAQAGSEFGDWAARLAIALLVLERTDSPALSAFSFTVSALPSLGLGPLLATLGDRKPRRRILVVSDLVRAGLYGVMALPVPTWALFPLVFVAATATPPFEAVRSAIIPETVPEDVYGSAVMVSGITAQTALLGGYALGGGLVAMVGTRGALAVNAATFAASALVLGRMRAGRAPPTETATARESLRRGTGFVVRDPLVRRTAVLVCAVAFGAIVGEVLAPAYARDTLGRGAGTAGLLSAAVPLGTVLVAVSSRADPANRGALRTAALWTAVTAAVAAAAYVADFDLPWVVLGFLAVGGVFGAMLQAMAIVGLAVPDDIRSSVFGILQAALAGAQGFGALAGGLVAELAGVRLTCAGALVLVALVALVETLRVAPERYRSRGPEPDATSA